MTVYRVLGMSCEGCAASVTKAIGVAAPGARVSVDLQAKAVTVEGGADADTVARAVGDAGFEFAGPVE